MRRGGFEISASFVRLLVLGRIGDKDVVLKTFPANLPLFAERSEKVIVTESDVDRLNAGEAERMRERGGVGTEDRLVIRRICGDGWGGVVLLSLVVVAIVVVVFLSCNTLELRDRDGFPIMFWSLIDDSKTSRVLFLRLKSSSCCSDDLASSTLMTESRLFRSADNLSAFIVRKSHKWSFVVSTN
jgi:hypothetical protein